MIKGFCLPDVPSPMQGAVDFVSRCALNCVGNFCERAYCGFFEIDHRGKDEMHMVRHYNDYSQVVLNTIVVQAAIQGDGASGFGEDPPMISAKGEEMRLIVSL